MRHAAASAPARLQIQLGSATQNNGAGESIAAALSAFSYVPFKRELEYDPITLHYTCYRVNSADDTRVHEGYSRTSMTVLL